MSEENKRQEEYRICKNCGKKLFSGYVVDEGEEYFCCDDCLSGWYSEQEYEELCENGVAYWTEWE